MFTEVGVQPKDLFTQNWQAMQIQNTQDQGPAVDIKSQNRVNFDSAANDSSAPKSETNLTSAFSASAASPKSGIDKVRLADDAHSFGGMLRDRENLIQMQPNETGTQTALRHISNAVGEATQRLGAMGILGQENADNQKIREENALKEELKAEQPAPQPAGQIPYIKLG